MTSVALETARYDIDDRVLTLTLARPERLNAFTPQMQQDIVAALDAADADDDVRAVVVTGDGRGFCAGADLEAGGATFAAEGDDDAAPRDLGGLVTLRMFDCAKPLIAAVNGPAVGIGATMTLPMDFRLASSQARFGFVFTQRGLVPEAASSWFLPHVVGLPQALEWTLTGRVFDAAEALRGGLVRSVHEPDDLLPAARAIAQELVASTSPVSVALTRRMLWRMAGARHPMEAHRADSRGIHVRGRSQDVVEGVTSFLEKRPPRFPDRVSEGLPDLFPAWTDPAYED